MPAQWGTESRDSPGMAPLPSPEPLLVAAAALVKVRGSHSPSTDMLMFFSLLLWPLSQGAEGKGTQAEAGARSEGSRRMSMEDLQGTPASVITHWAFSTLSFIVWEVFPLA